MAKSEAGRSRQHLTCGRRGMKADLTAGQPGDARVEGGGLTTRPRPVPGTDCNELWAIDCRYRASRNASRRSHTSSAARPNQIKCDSASISARW